MTKGTILYEINDFTLDVSWNISPGQALVLFGPSGAGKTTILRAIAGLIRPNSGFIKIGNTVVFDNINHIWVPPHKRHVGYMTQQYHLFPHLTVSRNIGYGLSNLPKDEIKNTVSDLIATFQLSGLENRYPSEISGGQQQRVAFARALASHPEVLLLDEPFASLDSKIRRTVRSEIRSILSETQIPMILVTHEIEEALAIGDIVQIVESGKTLTIGEPLAILGQPGQERVANIIGVENLIPMQVDSISASDGTMVCTPILNKTPKLEIPLTDVAERASVTVGIRASDIILSRDRVERSSARNQIQGNVTDIQMFSPGYRITLNCSGIVLSCQITGTSLSEMGIEKGSDVWAVFKASSCFIVRDTD
ncbi:MAG: ABC transporter ATP-binding protein [Chloroflexota bacterium]|nr:ABC transporter ATP-binding protein [Chloroflexota bacterium]